MSDGAIPSKIHCRRRPSEHFGIFGQIEKGKKNWPNQKENDRSTDDADTTAHLAKGAGQVADAGGEQLTAGKLVRIEQHAAEADRRDQSPIGQKGQFGGVHL